MAKRKPETSLLDLLAHQEETAEETVDRDRPAEIEPKNASVFASSTPILRLQTLQIENIWAYRQAELTFEGGVTVVAGPNGSGKSSLLESIFFALYGSRAGPAMERKMAEVLRLGTPSGRVVLSFSYGEEEYQVQQGLRRRKRGEGVSSDKESCRLLRRGDGAEWVGVENVAGEIEKLFGLSRDDFTNCVYVRQGEIDRLIRAGGEERRRMIDRLLRLELLDSYARRAKEGARRAVVRRHDLLESKSLELQREIESLAAEKLPQLQLRLRRELQRAHEEIELKEEKISQAEAYRLNFQEQLKRFAEAARQIELSAQELAQKHQQLTRQQQRQEQLDRSYGELHRRYETLQSRLGQKLEALKLDKLQVISSLNGSGERFEQIAELPQALTQSRERAGQLQRQSEQRREALVRASEKQQAARELLLQESTRLATEAKSIKRELSKSEKLVAAGRCPTCRQSVSAETFAVTRRELEAQLEQLGQAQSACGTQLELLEAEMAEAKKAGSAELQALSQALQALEEHRARLEESKELCLTLLKLKEQGRERKAALQLVAESFEALKGDVARLEGRVRELQGQLGDREQLRRDGEAAQALVSGLKAERSRLQRNQQELQSQSGVVANRLERLESLQQQEQQARQRLKQVHSLRAELTELQDFYGALKGELRRENVSALGAYFDEFFQLMGAGAGYRGVSVTDEYEIWIELLDGSRLSPALLSGGERALINIALRAAIHQVLSQGMARLPLILDEPTVYLDRRRIQRLQFLLEELGRRVGQVIVVSHEVGLVEGADHEYRTAKGPDNLSSIEKVR